jgi:hypothetical protein
MNNNKKMNNNTRKKRGVRLVAISPSSKRDKKLMAVFRARNGRTLTRHFGAQGHGDYIAYSRVSPAVARDKRRQYIARHSRGGEEWGDPTTPGALSRYLLWEKQTLGRAVAAFRRRFRV